MALITFEDLPSTNTPINATDLNTIQLEEYSTTEKIIGVWHDGRTIYRKVVRFNPDDSALATYTNHNISNINEILPTSSCVLHRNGGAFVPMSLIYPYNSVDLLNWSIGWQVDKTRITTWIGENMRAQIDTTNYGCVAILEYTKTN